VAELRSFLIGVVVAGVLLGIVALALGAFSGNDNNGAVARLLTTPAASPTVRSTQGPDTTVLPTLAPTTQPSPTATPTPEAAEPTVAPTNTPAPQPTVDPVSAYVSLVSTYVGDLDAQIDYLAGQGNANPTGSTQSAGVVKDRAALLQNVSPPACLSAAQGTLAQGAGEASAAADQLIAALASSDAGGVQTALSALSVARGTLAQGAAAVSSAPC
jgi:hypothetical protein